MPLLQILRPPGEKVSPGESHRVEEVGGPNYRVYQFVEGEWRLEHKHAFPFTLKIDDHSRMHCTDLPSKDSMEKHMTMPAPMGAKLIQRSDLRSMPLAIIGLAMEHSLLANANPGDMGHEFLGREWLERAETSFPVYIRHATEDSAQCYIWKCKSDRCVYVALRETSCLSSVVSDLVAISVEAGFLGNVNEAYARCCQWMEPFIRHHLDRIRTEFDTILCTGHSLGGACATLCSLILAEAYEDKQVSCITFGSPRVGDKSFGENFDNCVHQHLRIINAGDPVTALPVSREYVHVDDAIAIGSHGELERWPEEHDRRNWSPSWHEVLSCIRSSRLHSAMEYEARVHALITDARASGA